MDERLIPYAECIEGVLGALIKTQPSKIGVVLLCEKGSITEFHGHVGLGDKAQMAYQITANAIMTEVFANAAQIVAEAEEQEGR